MTTTFPATDDRIFEYRGIEPAAAELLFHRAHTAYSFTDEPVPDVALEAIHAMVRQAPTAMNTQPLRILFLRSDEAKARLLPHLAEGNRAKSESAPVVAVLAADHAFDETLPRLLPHAPAARELFADPERRAQAATFNATLQAGYFILAVRAAGYDAGPMGGFDAAGVDREFLGGTDQHAFLVVNIGRVADGGNRPRGPRLDWDEVVTVL